MSEIDRMRRHRDFPNGTCPASRHTAMIAERLAKGEVDPMIAEEPEHVAESLACTVKALWQARAQLARLGYKCRPDARGVMRWRKV